jgi:hypothetical protein
MEEYGLLSSFERGMSWTYKQNVKMIGEMNKKKRVWTQNVTELKARNVSGQRLLPPRPTHLTRYNMRNIRQVFWLLDQSTAKQWERTRGNFGTKTCEYIEHVCTRIRFDVLIKVREKDVPTTDTKHTTYLHVRTKNSMGTRRLIVDSLNSISKMGNRRGGNNITKKEK